MNFLKRNIPNTIAVVLFTLLTGALFAGVCCQPMETVYPDGAPPGWGAVFDPQQHEWVSVYDEGTPTVGGHEG